MSELPKGKRGQFVNMWIWKDIREGDFVQEDLWRGHNLWEMGLIWIVMMEDMQIKFILYWLNNKNQHN